MNHAVWKLAALGVVVAVGVFVVIHAQRGMQNDPAEGEPETASMLGDEEPAGPEEPADLQAPDQSEPEVAFGESGREAIPVAARLGGGAKKGAGKPVNVLQAADDLAADDEETSSRPSRTGGDDDPFDSLDDSERVADGKAKSDTARGAAGRKKPSVDIVDIEDENESGIDDKSEAPSADERGARRSGGPVLTLDDSDDALTARPVARDRQPAVKTSAPHRLGGPSSAPSRDSETEAGTDDPFSDDETAAPSDRSSRATRDTGDDDMDAGPDAPRELPKAIKSKPARGLNVDDAELEADAAPPAAAPRRPDRNGPGLPPADAAIETDEEEEAPPELPANRNKAPAELGRSIEADDGTAPSPPPARIGTRPGREIDAAPRDLPSFPDAGTDEETGTSTNITDTDDGPQGRSTESAPQLTIEKIAPPTAVLGRPMVYDIVVRNVGPNPAYQVTVEDVIPNSVKLDGTIPQAQLKTNKLIWNLGNLAAGAEKKIAVRVVPQTEGTVGSVATVNFAAEPKPAAQTAGPRLKFDVEAPRQAVVGTPVEFKFRVKNLGKVPASSVVIRDVLPAGLRHPDGDDLEFEIGQIPAGKEREVPLTLTAAQAGPTVNRVVVTAEGNVAEEAEVRLEVVGPALKVTRSGPKRLFPEKAGTYVNTVVNPGRSLLTGVTIVETVPAGMEFLEASDGGAYNAAKRSITWTIKHLAPDESQSVKAKLRASGRGTQISVVRASDPNGGSGETVGATQVSGVPALSIEVGEIAALIETGQTVTVGIRVINRGSDVAGNVRTSVTIPSGLQFVSATGPVDYRQTASEDADGGRRGTTVQFSSINKIDSRADATFELTLKARSPGEARLQVEARCDQLAESVRREEIATIVSAE